MLLIVGMMLLVVAGGLAAAGVMMKDTHTDIKENNVDMHVDFEERPIRDANYYKYDYKGEV